MSNATARECGLAPGPSTRYGQRPTLFGGPRKTRGSPTTLHLLRPVSADTYLDLLNVFAFFGKSMGRAFI